MDKTAQLPVSPSEGGKPSDFTSCKPVIIAKQHKLDSPCKVGTRCQFVTSRAVNVLLVSLVLVIICGFCFSAVAANVCPTLGWDNGSDDSGDTQACPPDPVWKRPTAATTRTTNRASTLRVAQ